MKSLNVIVFTTLMSLIGEAAMAQQTPANTGTSSRYRKIFTISGAGGGFALGMFGGLAKFDDAINADAKVTLSAVAGCGAGAVSGYVLGRVLDRHRDRAHAAAARRTVWISPLLSNGNKGARMSLSF